MRTSFKVTHLLSAIFAIILTASVSHAADPGATNPPTSEVSDQKAGSVLFYNTYTSSATAPTTNNTRINITNTSSTSAAFVHLFFVADSCAVADMFICLTANQTATFQASDVDPGINGYIVANTVSGVTGCPISFNFLIGDEYVRFATGHNANLGAEAFAALYTGTLPGCDSNSVTASLNFDGVSYNRAPRVLAVSNIPSIGNGNDTLLIINRVGGNLGTGAFTIGSLFGLLYDDAENVVSFTFAANVCQFRSSLSNSFPRTTPRFGTFIPMGRSGWMRIFNLNLDVGLLGAVINQNPGAGTVAGAYSGGHNMHKLTLSATNTYVVPVFPPSC
jgi:hypothetical protein